MKSKEDFVAAFKNELVGLLLEAFHEAAEGNPRFDHHKVGKAMLAKMKRAEALVGEMYAFLSPPPPLPQNGTPVKRITPKETV